MTREELAQRIYEVSHLTNSQFVLRHGGTSTEYFDKYLFEADPFLLNKITQEMTIKLIPSDTEVLAAMEMGGIPLATAISLKTAIPITFVRKDPKNYGTCKQLEGADPTDKKVCIIEDVVSTGGAINDALKLLGNSIIVGIACVIHRDEKPLSLDLKIPFFPLYTMSELEKFVNQS